MEGNYLKMIDTFFYCKASKKWTWKISKGETKHEIYFILTNKLKTVKNVAVLNTLKSSDHRMVRYKVTLDLKRKREIFQN